MFILNILVGFFIGLVIALLIIYMIYQNVIEVMLPRKWMSYDEIVELTGFRCGVDLILVLLTQSGVKYRLRNDMNPDDVVEAQKIGIDISTVHLFEYCKSKDGKRNRIRQAFFDPCLAYQSSRR